VSKNKKVLLTKEDQRYLQIIKDLNQPIGDGLKVGLKSRLHPDQIEQLKPLYKEGKKDLFLSCGRKWGKTELIGYVLWKHALENPGSACYYVGPEAAHARKIIWDGMRLQRFMGPATKKYIETIRNQEMMIRLSNGSFIQVVGSDNYSVANGLTPSIAVYDEFKAFNPRWHVEFAPNRAAKAAPLIIIGTKPRAGNKNMDQYNEILSYMRNDPDSYVADRTTFDNPINHLPDQKKIIDQEIAQLRARGEEDVVQLEYYSRVVPGGKAAIFPMFRRDKHIYPHDDLLREVEKDRKRLQWVWIADPGNTTCFGMLFAAFNEYTGTLYILDEIYEKDQNNTSVGVIVPRGKTIAEMLYPQSSLQDDWLKGCDDAAAWFMTEALSRYNIYFSPAEKWKGTKEEGLSLIKDQLIHGMVKISNKCENLANEMEKYAKDHNGKIPKKDDHLIDCYRYLNGMIHYDFSTITEAIKKKDPLTEGRFKQFEHDYDENEGWDAVLGDGFDLEI
jgi:hypothetical protein